MEAHAASLKSTVSLQVLIGQTIMRQLSCTQFVAGREEVVVPASMVSLFEDGHPIQKLVLKDNYEWGVWGIKSRSLILVWARAFISPCTSLYPTHHRARKLTRDSCASISVQYIEKIDP